jgi:type I restriction enzyme M protein
MDIAEFGYRTITVERPLRLRFAVNAERIQAVLTAKPVRALPEADRDALAGALDALDLCGMTRSEVLAEVKGAARKVGLTLPAPVLKAVWQGLSERDEDAEPCLDAKGNLEPDTALRDTQNVPLSEDINTYFQEHVLPYVPDAWMDESKVKLGYEIPFTRTFYRYNPPRPLEEIDRDLNKLVGEIIELLQEVEQ